MKGTFMRNITTMKKRSPHIAPIWFVLAERKDRIIRKIADIVFTTCESSVKTTYIRRDNRVSICVDDQTPQFSFVIIDDPTKIFRYISVISYIP
jgi:general stress protein 26